MDRGGGAGRERDFLTIEIDGQSWHGQGLAAIERVAQAPAAHDRETGIANPFWPPNGSTIRGRIEAEGRKAAIAKKWPSDCPYTVDGSRARLAWLDGFIDGLRSISGPGLRLDMARAGRDVLAETIRIRQEQDDRERAIAASVQPERAP